MSPEVFNEQNLSIAGDYHILPLSNSLEISSTQNRHEGDYKCVAEGAGKRRTSHTGRVRIGRGERKMIFLKNGWFDRSEEGFVHS